MPRTRSASAHRKVIEAALELVAARGFETTSMDAIAEASGVSKATLYKHWPDKDALLLEMMAEVNGLHARPPFDSGDPRRDIIDVLSYRPTEHPELRERIIPFFMAYSARNPSFGEAWRDMVMEPPRRELRRLLKQAIRNGDLTAELDIEVSLAMLLGPVFYWYVFLCRKSGHSPELAQAVVDAFWKAFVSSTVSAYK
jgi:AcrR family transcriptional regulator